MSTPISEKHLNIIESRSGIPSFKVELFDTTGSWNSKGFLATWYNVRSTPDRQLTPFGEFQDHIFGEDTTDDYFTWGVPLRTNYEQQLDFFWKGQPPDGIAGSQLSRGIWAVTFEGYLVVDGEIARDNIETKIGLRVYCPTRCRIEINNEVVLDTTAPTGIEIPQRFLVETGEAIPFKISLSNMEILGTTFQPTSKDMFFALEWFPDVLREDKSTGNQFIVSGSPRLCDLSHFVSGATVENTIGQPTGEVLDEITGLPLNVDETVWFDSPVISTTGRWQVGEEFFVTFEKNAGNSFRILIDGEETGKSVRPGDKALLELGGDRTVRVKIGNLEQNSAFVVRSPDFLKPLVDINGLPLIESINIQRNEDQAAIASFSVPLTKARYKDNKLTSDNCYSFDFQRNANGVLRKNRFIKIYQGYSGHLVPVFFGFIKSVDFNDSSTEKGLNITCLDLTKNLIDGMIEKTPDELTWLRIGNELNLSQFNPTFAADKLIKPQAYDAWKLVRVMRELCFNAGVSARALHGSDENGVSFVDDNGDTLEKTFAYPFTTVLGVDGSPRDLPYLWQFEFGTFYWDAIQRLVREFGRLFRFNSRGFVEFILPDNPLLLKPFTDTEDPTKNEFSVEDNRVTDLIEASSSPLIGEFKALRGFIWTQRGFKNNAFTIKFKGYGLALIITRERNTDAEISVEIDGRIVDGKSEIDLVTEDVGAPEYLLQLTNKGRFAIELRDEKGKQLLDSDQPNWYYKDGIHPSLRRNPTVIPITRNLQFGTHTCTISTHGDGSISLDGAFIFKRRKKTPIHIFTTSRDLVSMTGVDTDDDVRNSVTVIGSQRGVAGRAFNSKAVDIRSISDETSPAYIGYEKPMVIIQPSIRTQAKADFVALNVLSRYSRSFRTPSISSVGLPHLEEGDCVAVENLKFGFSLPIKFLPSEKLLVIDPDSQNRYWIIGLSTTMSKTEYTSEVTVTAFPPQPAHEKLQEIPETIADGSGFVDSIQNFKMTTDPSSLALTYNPYLEDTDKKLVKIEFDLIRSVRHMLVTVYNHNNYEYRKSPALVQPVEILLGGTLFNTLFFSEDFLPAGHYEYEWDGWWADESNGGSVGGGKYVPQANGVGEENGSNIVFRLNLTRDVDGIEETFYSDDDRHKIRINETTLAADTNVKRSITIFHDVTAYGDVRQVDYTFPASQQADDLAADYEIYDDRSVQEDNTGSLPIIMTVNRPGIIKIKCFGFLFQVIRTGNVTAWITKPIHAMVFSLFESTELMPRGTYSFRFTPSTQLRNMETNEFESVKLPAKIPKRIVRGLGPAGADPEGLVLQNNPNSNILDAFVDGIPPGGIIPFEYISPEVGKLDGEIWNAWFFTFPGILNDTGLVGFGAGLGKAGMMHFDKAGNITTNPHRGALPVKGTSTSFSGKRPAHEVPALVVQWFGNTSKYGTPTSKFTDTLRLTIPNGEYYQQIVGADAENFVHHVITSTIGGTGSRIRFQKVRN